MMHYNSAGSGFSYMLHPLPFAYKVNVTAQDPDLWTKFDFEFCGQVIILEHLDFRHMQALRMAMQQRRGAQFLEIVRMAADHPSQASS